MATFNAGYATNRQDRFTRSGALRSLRLARLSRCRRFRPSPCPTHYGGRWATMLSADVCLITPEVAAKRAARVMGGSGGDSSAFAPALRPAPMATTAPLGFDGDSRPFGLALSSTPIGTRTASETDFAVMRPCFTAKPSYDILSARSKRCFSPPDKDMNFRCATAAFTPSPAPGGLRYLVLTRPGTEPSMRFVFLGSHVCARASSRQPLARLPLPSASSFIGPKGHYRYSYRGLSPHQFMPMLGIHEALERGTRKLALLKSWSRHATYTCLL